MRARISPPIRAAGLQVVARAFHRQQIRARRESACIAVRNSSSVPKGSRVPWTNSAGVRHSGKKAGARLVRLPRRMQRIGEQQQSVGQIRTLRRDHRGLPAAIGMAAREHVPLHTLPQRRDRPRDAFAVARRRRRKRRSASPRHAKRQVVAQHQQTGFAKCPRRDSPAAARWHSTPLRASAPAHRPVRAPACAALHAIHLLRRLVPFGTHQTRTPLAYATVRSREINATAQAEPPAPPHKQSVLPWWGRRFRLPRPRAGAPIRAARERSTKVSFYAPFTRIQAPSDPRQQSARSQSCQPDHPAVACSGDHLRLARHHGRIPIAGHRRSRHCRTLEQLAVTHPGCCSELRQRGAGT